jgi:hypothetical protein
MDTISQDDEEVGIHIEEPNFEPTAKAEDEELQFDITDIPDDDLLRVRESVLNGQAENGGVVSLPVEASDSQVGYLELTMPDGMVVTLYPDHTWDVT